jgi:hypothetical protein
MEHEPRKTSIHFYQVAILPLIMLQLTMPQLLQHNQCQCNQPNNMDKLVNMVKQNIAKNVYPKENNPYVTKPL